MLVFTRVVTPTGSPRKVLSWAADITAYVNANSPLEVMCWSGTFGYPLGTLVWSTVGDSQVELSDAMNGLLAQDGYLDLVDAGAEFMTSPGEDRLRQLVYVGEGAGAAIEVGAVSSITTATALVDRMVDAVGWSVEIAQHVERLAGTPVGVFTNVYGQMGGISWLAIQPDVASSEASGAKVNADPDYLGRLEKTKDLFIPGSGHVARLTRIV